MCNRVCIIDKGSIVAVDTPSNLSERIQKSVALKLQIVAAVSDEVAKELSRLKSITRVEKFGGERVAGYKLPLLSFKIECSKDQVSARREVCSLLAEKGWELYSMTEDRLSLEDVFINLVNDHKAASEMSEDKTEASESSADGASEQNKPDDASLNKIEE